MNFKILYILVSIVLFSNTQHAYAQSDSLAIFKTSELKLRYYSPSLKDTIEIKKTNPINSVAIIRDSVITSSAKFNVNQLTRVSFQTGQGSFWSGFGIGTISGVLAGLMGGFILGNESSLGHGGTPLPGILILSSLGIIAGGITGGAISISNVSYTNYNFSKISDKHKKNELVRLLNKYNEKK